MVSNLRTRRSGWGFVGKFNPGRRHCRLWCTRTCFVLAPFIFFLVSVFQWLLPTVPPRPDFFPRPSCRNALEGYVLEETGICTETCGKLCFPRVHGVCFSHSAVTVCDGQPPTPQEIRNAWGGLPFEMRFYLEKPRTKVPVRRGNCPGWNSSIAEPMEGPEQARWIRGLQMVADLTLMPTGRVGPNPHHEAEKVVPAILFSQLRDFANSSLYWFANPNDPLMISKWSLGLLNVFSDDLRVEYLQPVSANEAPICFEDAVLFTGVTNSGYMPNTVMHDWFRRRVLEHCRIPVVEANTPVQDVVIVHRPKSSRNFWNYEAVKEMLERRLHVPVKMAVPGPWEFCEQVKLVSEADIVLTPHGSQNANLLVVRPGSIVMEVFPLLYYIDWYGHYLHAGRVKHYELYGTWPLEKGSMPLRMRVYAYLFGWQRCFFVRRCMNYGKSQKIYVDLVQLGSLLQSLTSTCSLVVPHSKCLQKG